MFCWIFWNADLQVQVTGVDRLQGLNRMDENAQNVETAEGLLNEEVVCYRVQKRLRDCLKMETKVKKLWWRMEKYAHGKSHL